MAGKSGAVKLIAGNLYIFCATFFWGVNYPFTKALVPQWMDADALSAARLFGGFILFWLASLLLKAEKLDKDSMLRAAMAGVIGLFGCIYLLVLALKYGFAIDISILMTLPPAFVLLMEVVFGRRRPSLLEYAGIAISFGGAAMVILAGGSSAGTASNSPLGNALGVAAGACYAAYLYVLAKPSASYKPVSVLRWVFLFGALPGLFLLPDLLAAPLLASAAATPWLEVAFIVFGPTFLAYFLIQPAIKDIGAVPVSIYQYLTPVVAAMTAMCMGQEKPSWGQGAAMLVIIAGMILTNIGKKREKAA